DGIRDFHVTGVQTCALPISEALPDPESTPSILGVEAERTRAREAVAAVAAELQKRADAAGGSAQEVLEAQAMIAEDPTLQDEVEIGRASCRERGWDAAAGGA